MVTDAVGHACCIKSLAEQETAGFLESQPLLELQGAHRGHGFEVVMESRDAHAKLARDAVNSERLVKVLVEAFNSPGDVGSVAPYSRYVAETVALFPHPEPVDDLTRDQRSECNKELTLRKIGKCCPRRLDAQPRFTDGRLAWGNTSVMALRASVLRICLLLLKMYIYINNIEIDL